jgi:hypothetical protein
VDGQGEMDGGMGIRVGELRSRNVRGGDITR